MCQYSEAIILTALGENKLSLVNCCVAQKHGLLHKLRTVVIRTLQQFEHNPDVQAIEASSSKSSMTREVLII